MGERPSGLNPEDLFKDIEPDESGAKPLQESDLSMTAEEERRQNAPARQERRKREQEMTEAVDVDVSDLEKEPADEEESVDVDVSDLEKEPADEENALEITSEDQEGDIEITETSPMDATEAEAARFKLSERLENLQAGEKLNQSEVQALMYDMAEQVAMERYGTAAPLDNIKDSQGNAVDFWNARPDAYQVFERQIKEGNPEDAFRIMEKNLDKWVPDFQSTEKLEKEPSEEAQKLEEARKALAIEGLNQEKETIAKLSEQLKADSEMSDKVLHRHLAETMKTLVNSNDVIPEMNELVTRLAPHVPDIKGTNVIDKTKEYIVQQALTNSKGEIKRRLKYETPEEVLAGMVTAVEKIKPGLERRIQQEQERQKRQREAKRPTAGSDSGIRPAQKRSWLDKLLGRRKAG